MLTHVKTREFLFVEFLRFLSNDALTERAAKGLPIEVDLVMMNRTFKRSKSQKTLFKKAVLPRDPLEEPLPQFTVSTASPASPVSPVSLQRSRVSPSIHRLSAVLPAQVVSESLETKTEEPSSPEAVRPRTPRDRWRLSQRSPNLSQEHQSPDIRRRAVKMGSRREIRFLGEASAVRMSVGTMKAHSMPPVEVTFTDRWASVGHSNAQARH
jgi:hypothetical protein